jgi:hypothetical protein
MFLQLFLWLRQYHALLQKERRDYDTHLPLPGAGAAPAAPAAPAEDEFDDEDELDDDFISQPEKWDVHVHTAGYPAKVRRHWPRWRQGGWVER